MKVTNILFTGLLVLFICSKVKATESIPDSFQQVTKYLTSNKLNEKRKMALFKLYIKTSTISGKDIEEMKKFLMTSGKCDSYNLYQTISYYLIRSFNVSSSMVEDLRKLISESIEKKDYDYAVWCIGFKYDISSSLLRKAIPYKEDSEDKYFELSQSLGKKNQNYIVDIFCKSKFQVYASAVKQNSSILSTDLCNALSKKVGKDNYYSVVKVFISEICKLPDVVLLKQVNNPRYIALMKTKDIYIFAKIADSPELSDEKRKEAAKIVSKFFFSKIQKRESWQKFVSGNINSLDRMAAAKKVITMKNPSMEMAGVAITYILNSALSTVPSHSFFDAIAQTSDTTDSISHAYSLNFLVGTYLDKYPDNSKIKLIYDKTVKNCYRLYEIYKPSPDDEYTYAIPDDDTGETVDDDSTNIDDDFFSTESTIEELSKQSIKQSER